MEKNFELPPILQAGGFPLEFSPELHAAARGQLLRLLRRESLRFGQFTLASGQQSNYYLDARRSTMSAMGSFLLSYLCLAEIFRTDGPIPADGVGGPPLGASPLVTGVSQLSYLLGRPLKAAYIRKETKDHGTQQLVEGPVQPGERIIMLEDVITTGGSVLKAIRTLREYGCSVEELICMILRDPRGKQALEENAKVKVHYLFTSEELLEGSQEQNV